MNRSQLEHIIRAASEISQIKVEVNTTMRGHVLPTRKLDIAEKVETEFSPFVSVNVISHAELFGGKICAALDRQHPRDLFDKRLASLFPNGDWRLY